MPERRHSDTDCICLAFLHCVYSNGFSCGLWKGLYAYNLTTSDVFGVLVGSIKFKVNIIFECKNVKKLNFFVAEKSHLCKT